MSVHLFDITGQCESREWIHRFGKVELVVLVVNLTCYDQVCLEEWPPQNNMIKTLALFDSIFNTDSHGFPGITLLLNNIARFESKLAKVSALKLLSGLH
ncbi:uncharacterized protein A1O9_09579 [Exophiala aquamarina CBS 119918]|uniref:Uncharacterized protein n=1 Tax=Exophiala aquamarina CBS 119918 TaxID=1182545 RepID=A0A072P565_9EURO|nr:uncharacterized protein A1O9_09579 [Exophiala aquamarina CBS 119918]KEF54413.1 hypothetical protein A1O9_09579 [Exophiala aquamarina CBS 119918]